MVARPPNTDPEVAVVVATRNREEDLKRCVAALHAQADAPAFEIVIVDDGSSPPVNPAALAGPVAVRILRAAGVGPATARNLGARTVSAAVVLFTDDDTVACEHWVTAASARLRDHPAEVGVEGPVTTPPYDALRAYSVAVDRPGHYWTCNVAYRRAVLDRLGGFAEEVFPYPHCEDRDLGFRALEVGPIGFAPDMCVVHAPRKQSALALARRGRWIASEIELARRHPSRIPRSRIPLPRPMDLLVGHAANWWRRWGRERDALLRDPANLVRFVVVATGHTGFAVAAVLKVALAERSGPDLVHGCKAGAA